GMGGRPARTPVAPGDFDHFATRMMKPEVAFVRRLAATLLDGIIYCILCIIAVFLLAVLMPTSVQSSNRVDALDRPGAIYTWLIIAVVCLVCAGYFGGMIAA